MNRKIYNEYVTILESELVPALGCTEPIALAYAAAKAKEVLGKKHMQYAKRQRRVKLLL